MPDINEIVRTNIRKFRAERGLTQEKLAFSYSDYPAGPAIRVRTPLRKQDSIPTS